MGLQVVKASAIPSVGKAWAAACQTTCSESSIRNHGGKYQQRTCIDIPKAIQETMTPFSLPLVVVWKATNIPITPARNSHQSDGLGLGVLWLLRGKHEPQDLSTTSTYQGLRDQGRIFVWVERCHGSMGSNAI
jgi:hypothetical protein